MAYFFSPFRKQYGAQTAGCPFCDQHNMATQTVQRAGGTLFENEHYMWIVNIFPKVSNHTMLVPKRHITQLAEESEAEVIARHTLLLEATTILRIKYPNCGIECFIQTGDGSESSVQHLHWHLFPALPEDPLRSFEKMGHFYTTEPNEKKVLLAPQPITMSPEELRLYLSQP